MNIEDGSESDSSRDLDSSLKSFKDQTGLHKSVSDLDFLPAGSITSQKDSIPCSEEESSHPPAGSRFRCMQRTSRTANFLPTRENVIIFEVVSPGAETQGDSGTSRTEEEDRPQPVKCFDANESYKNPKRKDDLFPHHEESKLAPSIPRPLSLDKSTMTISSDSHLNLTQEIEHLTNSCRRYDRQNQELRTELQSCTSDLMQLDQLKTRLTRELKKTQSRLDTLEENYCKIGDLIDSIIGGNAAEKPLKSSVELISYVCSRVELLSSKYTRLVANYTNTCEENTALKLQIDSITAKQMQMDTVKVMDSRKILKDKFISQLENTISAYKETLLTLQETNSEGENAVFACTEHFGRKLSQLVTDVQPFRSQQASPERLSPTSMQSSPRKYCLAESDVDIRVSEEVDIAEGKVLKPDNSVQVKSATHQKERKDRFQPVPMYRSTGKEPAFRICNTDDMTTKVKRPTRISSFKTKNTVNRSLKSTSSEPKKTTTEVGFRLRNKGSPMKTGK